MRTVRGALVLVSEFRRSFMLVNLLYFGLIAAAMVFVSQHREVQEAISKSIKDNIDDGLLTPVASAYRSGILPLAIAITFLINFFLGSVAFIALPSLVIPFLGFPLACWRAVTWGLIFAPSGLPTDGVTAARGGLIAGLLFLEGEGYVLATLAAYVQGKAFLFPPTAGAVTRKQGYWIGFTRSAQLYSLVAIQLMVAAIYEVLIVVVVMPHLK